MGQSEEISKLATSKLDRSSTAVLTCHIMWANWPFWDDNHY